MKVYEALSIGLVIGVLAVAGPQRCGGPATITVTKYICPELRRYPPEVQNKALAELELIEAQAPTIVMMLGDYKALRDGLRKCSEKPTSK